MSSADRVPYYLESRKDGRRITYVEFIGNFIMKRKSEKPKYKQSIISIPLPDLGDNNYKLHVFEISVSGTRLEGSKFFDFNPHATDSILISSEPSTGPSQKWELEECENCPDAWMIKSCNGRYLKNNGTGKRIAVYNLKSPNDRNDKSLHWILTPVF